MERACTRGAAKRRSRSVAGELICGDQEPHKGYAYQKPETDYAKRNDAVGIMYMNVETNRAEQAKPRDQS